jgi:hypothetical protein
MAGIPHDPAEPERHSPRAPKAPKQVAPHRIQKAGKPSTESDSLSNILGGIQKLARGLRRNHPAAEHYAEQADELADQLKRIMGAPVPPRGASRPAPFPEGPR